MSDRTQKLELLYEELSKLTDGQLLLIDDVVALLRRDFVQIDRLPTSDLIDERMLRDFGDALRLHHLFSREPFRKDRFEYALERVATHCGYTASFAPSGNPGYDLIIQKLRYSLKTEAAASIRMGRLHISKFMELGRGEWRDNLYELEKLRDQFIAHMADYDRILVLRCLKRESRDGFWLYELVEIPKSLLLQAQHGTFGWARSTLIPRSGYCYVYGDDQHMLFRLYFDGGGERKLQVQNIRKDFCITHATWSFALASQ